MRNSLLWQCSWPFLLTIALVGATAAYDAAQTNKQEQIFSRQLRTGDSLQKGLHQLTERHSRFINRVQDSILSKNPARQTTALRWAAQYYSPEVERAIAEMNRLIANEFTGTPEAKLQSELRRLEQVVARTQELTHTISTLFTKLYESVSADNLEAASEAMGQLTKHDRALQSSLRLASSTLGRTTSSQLLRLTSQERQGPLPWLPLLVWLPLALFLVTLPLRRLERLNDPLSTPGPAQSSLEKKLRHRFQRLQQDLHSTELLAQERDRETSRAQQNVRKIQHDLAVLRIYNDNLVNNLGSAVIVSNLSGTVTALNRAARTLFALPHSALGDTIELLPFFPTALERLRTRNIQLDDALDSLQPHRLENLPFSTQDSEKLLNLSIVPFQDESGAARGLLWVADDVTDSVRMKNQLLAAEHLATVGRMSAQVAHEIRNPLSAIGLNAELLQEEFTDYLPEKEGMEAVTLLRAIEHEIERLSEITEGYLQLTKNPKPTYESIDLNQSVNDLLTMISAELKQKSIGVELSLHSPAPIAWADPGQVRQALINIVRNGEEAMPEGGTLRIQTRQEPHHCLVHISDTGPGVPEEVQHRVFEPFYTTKSNGTGLGLSLTEQMIKEHGGQIHLQSTPPTGTTVSIQLPPSP